MTSNYPFPLFILLIFVFRKFKKNTTLLLFIYWFGKIQTN
ncbi:hypothetical protein M106_0374 [Bacteroides fragilis str. 1009-4-F |nr:hypothetical protein M106_0374 [Bacteroides fragilis str. 1009-4-F \